jgi:hypothetical protein
MGRDIRRLDPKYLLLLAVAVVTVLAIYQLLFDGAPEFQRVDTVELKNGSGQQHGVLVDGLIGGTPSNDNAFTAPSSTIVVGAVSKAAGNNEVIGFTEARAPAIVEKASWTPKTDNIVVNFDAKPYPVPVRVYVVAGDVAKQKKNAVDAVVLANGIWKAERIGLVLKLSTGDLIDATTTTGAASFKKFDCTQQASLQKTVGSVSGKVNIYYVEEVKIVGSGYGKDFGNTCAIGSAFVAMAAGTYDDLLAHELGHTFGLTHPGQMPKQYKSHFDATNTMWAMSIKRQYLTEGQVFSAHVNPNSTINSVYKLRAGKPTRPCTTTASATCVAIDKRIWSDGKFPAN